MTVKIKDIVRHASMADRPSYYSGIGASSDYLGSGMLAIIHEQIGANYGARAARAFVQMVSEIPKLAPTAFLQCLYALEANDWVWDTSCHKFSAVCLDNRPSGSLQREITMMAIEQLMIRDDTWAIREEFLRHYAH